MAAQASIYNLCLAIAALAVVGFPEAGRAQSTVPAEPVLERERPEVDPLGLRVGAFRLYPRLEIEARQNDNVFADESMPIDDEIVAIRPELRLVSDWTRHGLEAGTRAEVGRFQDNDSEDYEDLLAWIHATRDGSRSRTTVRLRHADLHQPRESADDVRGLEPTTYSDDSITAVVTYRPGRFSVRPRVVARTLTFDPTPVANGFVDNADRDRDYVELNLRAGFRIHPAMDVFVEGRRFETDYDRAIDDDGFARSSTGVETVVGAELDITGKLVGELYLGRREWEYDDPRFGMTDGPTFGMDFTWNATGLTTVSLSGARRVGATTIAGATDVEVTDVELGLDHELRRNIILSLRLGGGTETFEGVNREDDLLRSSFVIRYLMNRRLHVSLGYRHEDRDSSGADRGRRLNVRRVFLGLAVAW